MYMLTFMSNDKESVQTVHQHSILQPFSALYRLRMYYIVDDYIVDDYIVNDFIVDDYVGNDYIVDDCIVDGYIVMTTFAPIRYKSFLFPLALSKTHSTRKGIQIIS